MKHRAVTRHTKLQLDHARLTCAKTGLGANTETEAVECALALVMKEHRLDQPLKRMKRGMQLRRVFR